MTDLPPFLAPPPEREALELGLDHVIFDPVERDARAREEADDQRPPLRAYALLDASRSADIPVCLQGFANRARCLFDGAAGDEMAEVAPWLVELTRYSDVWDWLVEDGYGHNWGIVLHSRLELGRLKSHLKKFLKIEDEHGEKYYFKYYRPLYFNSYVPEFDAEHRRAFWQSIDSIHAEADAAPETLHRHAIGDDGEPVHQAIDLIAVGTPYLIQPASPDDAMAFVAAARGQS